MEINRKPSLTFLLFSAEGLRMVSSGRLGLGLADSQELKKDWMKGSRFCPLCKKKDPAAHRTRLTGRCSQTMTTSDPQLSSRSHYMPSH